MPRDLSQYTITDEFREHIARVAVYYHVPRSQVWEGSRGRQRGNEHLHVDGRALCGRHPWYPRPLDPDESFKRCPTCVKRAAAQGIEWPASVNRPTRGSE